MRKLFVAIALALLLAAKTTAHTTEAIKTPIFVPYIPTFSWANKPDEVVPNEYLLATPTPAPTPTPKPVTKFKYDPEVSWYGPGFYGKRTACGHAYTKHILGVAHRSLPCGTRVTFRWEGKVITVPVIDRGPYVKGRTWDLSGGLCVKLDHCFTGPIEFKVEKE